MLRPLNTMCRRKIWHLNATTDFECFPNLSYQLFNNNYSNASGMEILLSKFIALEYFKSCTPEQNYMFFMFEIGRNIKNILEMYLTGATKSIHKN